MGKIIHGSKRKFRLIDFLVIVLCLFTIVCSINLFRLDLFQTIEQKNVKPVGTITIKNNIVQRRIADRVLWDRLRVESPVYVGDIIRVADLSEATLNISGQKLDLEENTLVRIQLSDEGALQIALNEGNLGVTTGEDTGGLQVAVQGKVIETGKGTAVTTSAGKNGVSFQVVKGSASFIEEEGGREITSGTILSFDAEGELQHVPAVVVSAPLPNARYINDTPKPFTLNFAWNRVNLDPKEPLRLDIASDRNFNRITQSLENLNDTAAVRLAAGTWNWRITYQGAALSSGRLIIEQDPLVPAVEEPPPPPFAAPGNRQPANGYRIGIEELKANKNLVFRWSGVRGANTYTVTLYQKNAKGRRQIRRIPLGNRTSWTLTNVGSLGRGEFVWRVEAAYAIRDGTIERTGRAGENTFVIDIPIPEVKLEYPGVLYGY
jgi:hypothetical protein